MVILLQVIADSLSQQSPGSKMAGLSDDEVSGPCRILAIQPA